MEPQKTGGLIKKLRQERGLTQAQLAGMLGVGDKAVSKWERGLGCPDVELFPAISKIFGVEIENLLAGDLCAGEMVGGNMKKLKFYVCESCGNVIVAEQEASVSCCGKKLSPATAQVPGDDEKLTVEQMDSEYYVTSEHEMTKEHYISFIALLTGDCVILKKLYPEWNVETRLPFIRHGTLLWYCTKHGFFSQQI